MPPQGETFGQAFAALVEGEKNADVAKKLGCSPPHVSQLKGDQYKPGVALLENLIREYHLEAEAEQWYEKAGRPLPPQRRAQQQATASESPFARMASEIAEKAANLAVERMQGQALSGFDRFLELAAELETRYNRPTLTIVNSLRREGGLTSLTVEGAESLAQRMFQRFDKRDEVELEFCELPAEDSLDWLPGEIRPDASLLPLGRDPAPFLAWLERHDEGLKQSVIRGMREDRERRAQGLPLSGPQVEEGAPAGVWEPDSEYRDSLLGRGGG